MRDVYRKSMENRGPDHPYTKWAERCYVAKQERHQEALDVDAVRTRQKREN